MPRAISLPAPSANVRPTPAMCSICISRLLSAAKLSDDSWRLANGSADHGTKTNDISAYTRPTSPITDGNVSWKPTCSTRAYRPSTSVKWCPESAARQIKVMKEVAGSLRLTFAIPRARSRRCLIWPHRRRS